MSNGTLRIGAFVLSFLLTIEPLLAQPHTIAKLGQAPLLGATSSRSSLLVLASRNSARLAVAAHKLGMTAHEFRAFKAGLASASYGLVPRHLDGMAWYSGHTYVLRDVIIPAGTLGWEVDVYNAGHELRVFIPASCGNLSILRQMVPRVATRHIIKSGVMAYSVSAGPARKRTSAASPLGTPAASIPTPGPPAATPIPSATPTRTPEVVAIHPPAAPRAHGFPWFVLGVLLPIFFHGGGGGQQSSVVPLVPTPTPKPTCPGK